MKIRLVFAELFHAEEQKDRLTDMMNLIVGFLNFANVPKNDSKKERKKRTHY
jgi:hypothetical protein